MRLLKPAHRAAKMRTVDGENLELLAFDSSHPARDISSLTIPGPRVRIAEGREPCLTGRKTFKGAERNPRLVRNASNEARKDIADNRDADKRRGHYVERGSKLEQKTSARRGRYR